MRIRSSPRCRQASWGPAPPVPVLMLQRRPHSARARMRARARTHAHTRAALCLSTHKVSCPSLHLALCLHPQGTCEVPQPFLGLGLDPGPSLHPMSMLTASPEVSAAPRSCPRLPLRMLSSEGKPSLCPLQPQVWYLARPPGSLTHHPAPSVPCLWWAYLSLPLHLSLGPSLSWWFFRRLFLLILVTASRGGKIHSLILSWSPFCDMV